MAIRIADRPAHGTPVLGPPENWRPRALSVREKLEVVIRQGGREPGGERLNALEGIHFDHQPPIQLRAWDEEAQDTIPPSCSLEHIVALNAATHVTKTATKDVPAIAKVKRLTGKTRTGPKAKIASRGFAKPPEGMKRKIQSRGFVRKPRAGGKI